MADFFAYAEKEGVKKDDKGYAASEKLIKSQLKGLIAQKLWDMVAYYAIFNTYDPEVQKAVAVMKDDNIFKSLENVK